MCAFTWRCDGREWKRKTDPARTNNNRLNVLNTRAYGSFSFSLSLSVCVGGHRMCLCVCPFSLLFTPWLRLSCEWKRNGEMWEASTGFFGPALGKCVKREEISFDCSHIRKALATLSPLLPHRITLLWSFFRVFVVCVCVCSFTVQIQEPCNCLAMRLHFDGYTFFIIPSPSIFAAFSVYLFAFSV